MQKIRCCFDDEGNQYIDAISSWWVTLHGHGNEYIAQKIYQQALQLEQVIFAGFTHQPAVELAEKLLPILPNNNFSKIFYSDNGSTSTEVAIKMALQFWWNTEEKQTQKTHILAFKNAYHGDTFGAMSVSGRNYFTTPFQQHLFDVLFIDLPTKNNIDELCNYLEQNAKNLAAFVFEPLVQGAGGMKMYDAIYLDKLIGTAKKHNIICIADEVMTGFGRTGKLFATNYLNNKVDIICLSKALTGGTLPLGITACTQKIYNAFYDDDKQKTFFHGHSFTANPLSCTAALASLDLLLQPSASAAIASITASNKAFAHHLQQYNAAIKNIRCLGTIIAFELCVGDDNYLNNISLSIIEKALNKGVFIRPLGNTIYIMPPLCITKNELEKVYNVIEEIVLEMKDEKKYE